MRHPIETTEGLVFVYGSLKRGLHNNRLLQETDSYFVCEVCTEEAAWDLVSLGSFPGMIEGDNQVAGELWQVDEIGLRALDRLESEGSLYARRVIEVVDSEGERAQAFAYIFLGCNGEHLEAENGVHVWERALTCF